MTLEERAVLFLCSANAARSQIAEGLLKHHAGAKYQVFSAGLNVTQVHPMAIQVMSEIGIDISQQRAKNVSTFLGKKSFYQIISVCKITAEDCPRIFPGTLRILHWPLDDPAAYNGSDEEKLGKFREIRDQILIKIQDWLKEN